MNEGIEILLKRMDSHPEEFETKWGQDAYEVYDSRWGNILHAIKSRVNNMMIVKNDPSYHPNYTSDLPFLSDEEVMLVYNKWESLQGPAFTRAVMDRLLTDYDKRHDPKASNTTMSVKWSKKLSLTP